MANNPNPAQLSFKIKNADLLESIVPNTKLINPSEMLSTPNGKVFEFKMDALKELLKVQSEINPNAAYFNIDLLKYQVKLIHVQGPRNDFFLGEAPCFFSFQNATFLKNCEVSL